MACYAGHQSRRRAMVESASDEPHHQSLSSGSGGGISKRRRRRRRRRIRSSSNTSRKQARDGSIAAADDVVQVEDQEPAVATTNSTSQQQEQERKREFFLFLFCQFRSYNMCIFHFLLIFQSPLFLHCCWQLRVCLFFFCLLWCNLCTQFPSFFFVLLLLKLRCALDRGRWKCKWLHDSRNELVPPSCRMVVLFAIQVFRAYKQAHLQLQKQTIELLLLQLVGRERDCDF